MDIITSLENKKIKYINKLKTKKFRDEEGLFIVETKHLVEEAYKSGFLTELYLVDTNIDSNILEDEKIIKYEVTKDIMNKISSLENLAFSTVAKSLFIFYYEDLVCNFITLLIATKQLQIFPYLKSG